MEKKHRWSKMEIFDALYKSFERRPFTIQEAADAMKCGYWIAYYRLRALKGLWTRNREGSYAWSYRLKGGFIGDFETVLRERFGDRAFTRSEAEAAVGCSTFKARKELKELVKSSKLFVNETLVISAFSFKPFPADVQAYALKLWKETFKSSLFSIKAAAEVSRLPFRWASELINRERTAGRLSFNKRSGKFTFQKLRVGRKPVDRDRRAAPIVKVSEHRKKHIERLELLSAEFPPPCVFTAYGASDVLGISVKSAAEFLRRCAERGELVSKRDGRETDYRFRK